MGEVSTRKHPKWRNRTSDGRFWIGKPGFLFEFQSNHTSISLSFGDIRVWQTDRRTDNADHCYSWPPHCGGIANKGEKMQSTDARRVTYRRQLILGDPQAICWLFQLRLRLIQFDFQRRCVLLQVMSLIFSLQRSKTRIQMQTRINSRIVFKSKANHPPWCNISPGDYSSGDPRTLYRGDY